MKRYVYGVMVCMQVTAIYAITFENKTSQDIVVDVYFSPTNEFVAKFDDPSSSSMYKDRLEEPQTVVMSKNQKAKIEAKGDFQNIPFAIVVRKLSNNKGDLFSKGTGDSAYYNGKLFRRKYPQGVSFNYSYTNGSLFGDSYKITEPTLSFSTFKLTEQ
jgi:hypothetical protein